MFHAGVFQAREGGVGYPPPWIGTRRRPCLLTNRAIFTQKWPPSSRNVAASCELTETTKPRRLFFLEARDIH